eukprot:2766590-Lingulodinium_polyedra.AAC.1
MSLLHPPATPPLHTFSGMSSITRSFVSILPVANQRSCSRCQWDHCADLMRSAISSAPGDPRRPHMCSRMNATPGQ